MNVIDRFADKLMPIMAKVSSQRHLVAIRDSFIETMPLIMAASLMTLLNALVFTNESIAHIVDLGYLSRLAIIITNGTMNIMAIIVAYQIGSNLAKEYIRRGFINDPAFSELHSGVLAVGAMFIVMPLETLVTLTDGTTATATGVYSTALTSSSGVATAMICGLISTELFCRLARVNCFKIKMPDGVPPAVAKSFNSLIPEMLVVLLFGILVYALDTFTGYSVPQLIELAIQLPLKGLVLSVGGMLGLQFVSDTLWVFGMHGSSILAPIRQAPMLEALQENMLALQHGAPIPNIITENFTNAFGLIGGGGCILPLTIALFISSRRPDYRKIAKLGVTTTLFNITEPVMFGLPVVLNPVFMIPCAIIPSINLIIAYACTAVGIIGRISVSAPWVTPPVLQTYIASSGDIPATILTVLLIGLDIVLFLPFVIASNRTMKVEANV
ncbi:PTS system, lactose/cellobiose family IIC subunit [Coriobacterium glomerans PW2]|uniref:Permease IIC component n=1 Tax=Coriobacterium glomerans (strain ATCC 49209 / DSM 20642 / JCM 10262 / PW2) TaxID=700015 RepID=F2N9A6_CORGP|nr:PTS transporter subunit EIIC [Coriobacterium glomerans]AEB07854.1 PTS system, lactose/cellobiose family IIC subunit [Coriobacterium glomerans PW2]